MAQYYFLLSALPPLHIGRPGISFKELKGLFALNLSKEDKKKVEALLRPIDLYNMRAFWLGLPLDDRGNLSPTDLEDALLTQEGLPEYVRDFLDRYESTPERLRYFASLFASLYREERSGFLKKYFAFERDVRLILTALRAKATGRDIVRELQFEEPTDSLVMQILAQKDSPDYTPPQEFEDLKTLFVDNRGEPAKLERAILHYRFEKIEEMEEPQDFSIDRILAYTARFLIALSISEQSKELGLEQLSRYE